MFIFWFAVGSLGAFGIDADFQNLSPLAAHAPVDGRPSSFDAESVKSSARMWGELRDHLPIARVPNVASAADLQSYFREMRDDRYLHDPAHSNFLRRITWQYPDDGCYLRADLGVRRFESRGNDRPGKVFVFGKLRVTTSNHPKGRVGWWYHVAPVMRVGMAL